MKRIIVAAAAVITIGFLSGASGCQDTSKGKHCNPGDTRGSKGHTDICDDNGKWKPMTKQVKP